MITDKSVIAYSSILPLARRAIIGKYFPPIPWPMTGGGKGAVKNSPSPASSNKMVVHPSPAKAKAKFKPNKAVESDGVNDDSASFSDIGGNLQLPMNAPFLGGNFIFCECRKPFV